ncbi:MAG: hypothetical protein RDV48_00535 [Candidatus Eremiobacteraeota bacterium]|nr:hypothetical protein [Candidatus Eremiobacteraeota bacterium]
MKGFYSLRSVLPLGCFMIILGACAFGAPKATLPAALLQLCDKLATYEIEVQGTLPITVKMGFGTCDSALNSPLSVSVEVPGTGAADRLELWVAREDYVDREYRFPRATDEIHLRKDLVPQASTTVGFGPMKRGNIYYAQVIAYRGSTEAGRSPLVIRAALIPAPREALNEKNIMTRIERSSALRDEIFRVFGFKPHVAALIKGTSSFYTKDPDKTGGAGGWYPWDRIVIVDAWGRQAGLHELAHAFWHDYRKTHEGMARKLARDVVKLSEMDPAKHGEYKEAITFARGYVNGVGDWKGMYAGGGEKVKDVYHLSDEDFQKRVLDWEIFAGFSSWTMGQYKAGPHMLPQFMWLYLDLIFSGRILEKPYYEGGKE